MSKIMDTLSKFLAFDNDEDTEKTRNFSEVSAGSAAVEGEPKSAEFTFHTKAKSTTCTVNTTARFEVVVMSPEVFEDAKDIADYLNTKNPVVINLESCERDVTRRIIDFLSGAVYAVHGNIQKISNDIFLVTPYNVSVLGNFKDDVRKTVLPWESVSSDYR